MKNKLTIYPKDGKLFINTSIEKPMGFLNVTSHEHLEIDIVDFTIQSIKDYVKEINKLIPDTPLLFTEDGYQILSQDLFSGECVELQLSINKN